MKSFKEIFGAIVNAELCAKFENAEIIKCVDNGLNTTLRLRTDSEMIEVKVKTYDFEE